MTPPKKDAPKKAAPRKEPAKTVPRRGRATPGKAEPTPPPKDPRTAVSEAESNVIEFGRTKKPRSTGQKTSSKTVDVAQRRSDACALRRQGGSWPQIAEAIREKYRLTTSYDDKAAWADVRAGIEKIRVSNIMEYVEESNSRLDAWLLRVSKAVTDKEMELGSAIDVMLRIEKRRADLLGLDAARRIQITGIDGGPIEFAPADTNEAAYDAAVNALNEILGPPRELPG